MSCRPADILCIISSMFLSNLKLSDTICMRFINIAWRKWKCQFVRLHIIVTRLACNESKRYEVFNYISAFYCYYILSKMFVFYVVDNWRLSVLTGTGVEGKYQILSLLLLSVCTQEYRPRGPKAFTKNILQWMDVRIEVAAKKMFSNPLNVFSRVGSCLVSVSCQFTTSEWR